MIRVRLVVLEKVYTLESFVDAAADSRFHYVATNEAAPGTFQEGDPDLAAFPAIEDYYEIRYGEVLPPIDAEGSLAAASISSQSEVDIQQMRIDPADNKGFFIKQFYPVEKWLQDRGLVADPEVMIREYASKSTLRSVEQVREYVKNHGLGMVQQEYIMDHITRDFADSLNLSVEEVQELLRSHKPDFLYGLWILENFEGADSVGEVCARLGELGLETQIRTGANLEEVASHVKSTESPAVVAVVDMDELELGDEPLHYFWEKCKEMMSKGGGRPYSSFILFVPAVVYGVVETVGAAFDIGGDSPDGLVRVEFGDDFVNVTWPNGEEESFSHDVFERAFEDSRFSYILLKT